MYMCSRSRLCVHVYVYVNMYKIYRRSPTGNTHTYVCVCAQHTYVCVCAHNESICLCTRFSLSTGQIGLHVLCLDVYGYVCVANRWTSLSVRMPWTAVYAHYHVYIHMYILTYTCCVQVNWPTRADALDGKLGDDYFSNGEISTRVSIERAFAKLTETPDRMSWGSSTPLEVNAFYGPKSNGCVRYFCVNMHLCVV